jgi:hypothetical protein
VKYATWKLNFIDANYGTGPEEIIVAQGIEVSGAWEIGSITEDGKILGYLSAEPDLEELSDWDFQMLTQAEALALAQTVNPEAELMEDGTIGVSEEE